MDFNNSVSIKRFLINRVILFLLLGLSFLISSSAQQNPSNLIKTEKSKVITQKAIHEIDKNNLNEAYGLVKNAISLDPSNTKAKELYVRLHELFGKGKWSNTEKMNKRFPNNLKTQNKRSHLKSKKEISCDCVENCDKILAKRKEEIETGKYIEDLHTIMVKATGVVSFSESNYLRHINSSMVMGGAGLSAEYYNSYFGKKAGLSINYLGLFLKFDGDDRINFITHRVDGFLLLRTFLFSIHGERFEVGLKFGYQYFYLGNKEPEGAYYYTSIWGPAIGLFIRDPVLYRLWNTPIFKKFRY